MIENIDGLPDGVVLKAGDPEYVVATELGPRWYIKAVHKMGVVASFTARLRGNTGGENRDYSATKVYSALDDRCIDTYDRITDGAFDAIFVKSTSAGSIRLELATK